MKLLVCGERYSSNLGDGAIAMGLEAIVQSVQPGAIVDFVDLSDRSGYTANDDEYGSRSNAIRRLHRAMFQASYGYGALANAGKQLWLNTVRREADRTRPQLPKADRLVIGGGQLLQDNRLSFPIALRRFMKAAREQGMPISYFSVGAGGTWSSIARRLLRSGLLHESVEHIICRDTLSAQRLVALYPEIEAKVAVTADAALAIEPGVTLRQDAHRIVGLNVMHPTTIRWTARDHPFRHENAALQFWVEAGLAIHARGLTFRLFTNGNPEDQEFAGQVRERMRGRMKDDVVLLPRPRSPDQLFQDIAGFRCMVANRLHANIIATVLGVPCIAMGWDDKVEEFMRYSGQSAWFVPAGTPPEAVAERVARTLESPGRNVPIEGLREELRASMAGILDGKTPKANRL